MTLVLSADRPFAGRAAAASVRDGVLLVGAAALWALCHPYGGLIGDSTIYIGRALADLDPRGMGRDLAFAFDGQSRFSLFPFGAKALVAGLGPARAGVLIAVGGSVCFFAALVALARALAPPRLATAIILALCVLPVSYGQVDIFHFGEASALPRPFAEAAVLAGMAALVAGRYALAPAALAVALALHPIMALAGVGTASIFLIVRGGRQLRLAAIGAAIAGSALAVALALRGVPLFGRLLVTVDPAWLAFLVRRSPHLFPTLWSGTSFCPVAAQAATIAIAASFAAPRARSMLLCVLGAALIELAAAALFADRLHILLALQVQLWRATWLLAVIGGASLVLCLRGLWDDGPLGRIVLALIALAWFFQPSLATTAAISGAALVLRFGSFGLRPTNRHAVLVAAAAGTILLIWLAGPIAGYIAYLKASPAGLAIQPVDALRNNLHTFPVLLAVAAWLLAARAPIPLPIVCGGSALLVLAATAMWDQRSPYQSYVEAGQPPAAFDALVADRSAEVLWIDDLADAWFLFRRPQWEASEQAVGAVFSRELAFDWQRRAQALVALGLAHQSAFQPWKVMAADDRIRVTPAAIAAFCRRSDAPRAVVVPVRDDRPALDVPGSVIWPIPTNWAIERYAIREWHATKALQALRCRDR